MKPGQRLDRQLNIFSFFFFFIEDPGLQDQEEFRILSLFFFFFFLRFDEFYRARREDRLVYRAHTKRVSIVVQLIYAQPVHVRACLH